MEIGVHRVMISSNSLASIGDKNAVRLLVKFRDGEETDVMIWLTDKAAGIARQNLKKCGFDVDAEDLGVLSENPHHLAGKMLDVMVDEYPFGSGKLRASIPLQTAPSKREVTRLQGLLRNAKKDNREAAPAAAPSGAPSQDELPEDDIPF